MNDVELLADLLGGDRRRRIARANVLLRQLSVPELMQMSEPGLVHTGLSTMEARRLRCAADLGRRVLHPTKLPEAIHTPQDAYNCVAAHLVGCDTERFVVAALDVRNRPRRVDCIASGSVDSCPVDPREVFGFALRERASGILVAHNHPSGDPEPSSADHSLTRRLKEAADILGLPLLDHLVVAGSNWVSFAERGWMPGASP